MTWLWTARVGLAVSICMGLGAVAFVNVADRADARESARWFDTLDISTQRDSLVARAARVAGAPVKLMIALSHAENWSGDSAAVNSRSGAIGLMQVMPVWQHRFEGHCGCAPLINREKNVCTGVHVYLFYLDSLKRVEPTLRAYVGQRRMRSTGDKYVADVLENLSRLSP